ncbi:hypothetical protein HYI19_18580 [Clostridium botulinum]|uniref:hypothetical protein n=1 Tax=Clostridium botulinum TaxID=1491 RepID=UPI001C9A60B9|nr:hypothetical protein [Clostridium botulinum]MBY6846801.1 hypothetical protein [Clostridium botulinum]
MSEETKHLKLFKYDKETDDFNTTTFNIKKCLNDNWDKIDLDHEDTTKEITELKLKDEEQQQSIDKIMSRLTLMTCRRTKKVPSGIFQQVRWYDSKNKIYALSDVTGETTGGNFIPKQLSFHFYGDGNVIEKYIFNLKFDEDDDLTEMELVSHV